jgi:hypothetical protein
LLVEQVVVKKVAVVVQVDLELVHLCRLPQEQNIPLLLVLVEQVQLQAHSEQLTAQIQYLALLLLMVEVVAVLTLVHSKQVALEVQAVVMLVEDILPAAVGRVTHLQQLQVKVTMAVHI